MLNDQPAEAQAQQAPQAQANENTQRNLRIGPFIPTEDLIQNGRKWEEWLESMERELRYFRIKEDQDKEDALIIFGGPEIARLKKSLPDPENGDRYTKLKTKLGNYFKPQQNKQHSRYKFNKLRQTEGESTASYVARLREAAADCEFGDNKEERLLEHLVQTSNNSNLVQKAINKRWNLQQFVAEATQLEDLDIQMKEMKEKSTRIGKVRADQKKRENFRHPDNRSQPDRHSRRDSYNQQRESQQRERYRTPTRRFNQRPRSSSQQKPCSYCGLKGKHPPGKNCPAYGKQCHKCGIYNHFATCCKPRARSSGNIKKAQTEDWTSAHKQESSDEEDFFVKHLKVKRIRMKEEKPSTIVQVRVADQDIWAEADSGAEANIMDEHQYRALINRSKEDLTLQEPKVKLKQLQNDLGVVGQFETTVRNKTRGIRTTFVVVNGHIDSKPLLNRDDLIELGMLDIRNDGTLLEPNGLGIRDQGQHYRIQKIGEKPDDQSSTEKKIEEIKNRYRKVFDGVGLIKDPEGKPIYGHFNMKAEAQPVAQKPRIVPYYLKEPLKKYIDQGIEEDIFEKIPPGEPVTWCSPLVVQPKPRFAQKEELEPHMIRASVDLRVPNSKMERNRITQPPVVEDFIHKFNDCRIWSKLDLRQGYHQLLLDDESRNVATFSTPWGNVRPKRLVFGAKASQDIFDEAMYRVFGDIPRCLNQRDDILIGGRNIEEHNATLEEVMKRAETCGVTFNEEKCEFAKEEIEFYGYLFTKNGLRPTEKKIEAIKRCGRPESKTEIRSFLGMTGYLSKFIPRYTSLTAPLRKITEKDERFVWGDVEETAFRKLKDSIASSNTIAFFDPSLPIQVRAEASFNEGISAGLFQSTAKGTQPVHFISRTLTATEKNYSQTEKDALAIKWAKDRFKMYLHGAPRFRIITAHKPLLPLFNKPTARLPPRIEKWVMSMQDVDYELVYEPGKDEADPLDFLSRHPLPETEEDRTECLIKKTVEVEHAVVLEEIQKYTEEDSCIQKLKDRIQKNDWDQWRKDPDITPYSAIRQELYVAEELVFRLHQIVLPQKLRMKAIRAAHKMGHFGITKTKQMLRERYWFPEMNQLVEEEIGRCYECKVTTRQDREEPIKPTEIPEGPWEVVSVDFGGPYPDGHYNLVVIDKRTRYPEVMTTSSTAFRPTKEKLQEIFATHGNPRRLESDNGPPFNSREFAEWTKEEGIDHHRVTPEHPRSNGEAESFMKILNKQEQIAHYQRRDRKEVIRNMLIGYRSTPHPGTGVTPYEAMMYRKVRNKLDYVKTDKSQVDQSAISAWDQQYKTNMKRQRENKNTREHRLIVGDYVLVKQRKVNKYSTPFEPNFYIVTNVEGSRVTARRWKDGREITRDGSQFKLANNAITEIAGREDTEEERESILLNAKPPVTDAKDNDEAKANTNTEQRPSEEITETVAVTEPEPEIMIETESTKSPVKTPVTPRPVRLRSRPRKYEDYHVTWAK